MTISVDELVERLRHLDMRQVDAPVVCAEAASKLLAMKKALVEARKVVKSDADACGAFGPDEMSEPKRVLEIIDRTLLTSEGAAP